MILLNEKDKLFHLQTKTCSYILQILPSGHPANLYYGKKITHSRNFENFIEMNDTCPGSTTSYSDKNHAFSLNFQRLEYSSYGKGDYRNPAVSLMSDDGNRTFDFIFESHMITDEKPLLESLPSSYPGIEEEVQSLELKLTDMAYGVSLYLNYCVFPEKDILTRNVRLENNGNSDIDIEKISSMSIDFDHFDFDLITLDGAWIRERHNHRRALNYGISEISSRKGVSSPDHNPFLVLCDKDTTECRGDAYGFALMYSGNHSCSTEVSTHENTRVMLGINEFDFSWKLKKGMSFQTPEVALTYSHKGLNGMSSNYHRFIRDNIVRGEWQYKERPVLINNWEATYFNFNEKKLLKLAKEAVELGIELFVLDDGWFGKRNDDKSSLGDWYVNKKKLPSGIGGLARKIKSLGLDFGIWVEPEMISIDSDLYRAHPEWMVKTPEREASPGRYQYLLDLSNPEVCDYIYKSMKDLFSSADISYVKWDMNRNFSDIYSEYLPVDQQKEFSHRYVLGLYDILGKITKEFPEILFESCASGGGRFDLAMFSYMPQIWTSDDTDAMERLHIQYGSSMLAPPSVMGAHVSSVPNHQVIRNTPIESRFNTAAFGLLGYEMDLTKLGNFQKKVIKKQIAFYKENRKILQYGDFFRINSPSDGSICLWMALTPEKDRAVLGYYQQMGHPNPGPERYRLAGLDKDCLYTVRSRTQFLDIRQFGELINEVLPVEIKTEGFIHNKIADNYLYKLDKTEFRAIGDQLLHRGFAPRQQFFGTGLDDKIAFVGDFGSRLYILEGEKQ